MNHTIYLKAALVEARRNPEQQRTLFALLNLGILESLTNGVLSATDALSVFFHAENCLYVRQQLRDRNAEDIMSHGVQLPDLFDVLPAVDAQHEFQRELAMIRALCLTLLQEKQLAA